MLSLDFISRRLLNQYATVAVAYTSALERELLPTLTDELHHLNAADRLDQSVVTPLTTLEVYLATP